VFYNWEAHWGGSKLSATEPQVLLLYNAGPTVGDAEVIISAMDATGQVVALIRPLSPELPRGEIVRVEVPSYEIPDDAQTLTVALATGDATALDR
jgi:hypothetical protein